MQYVVCSNKDCKSILDIYLLIYLYLDSLDFCLNREKVHDNGNATFTFRPPTYRPSEALLYFLPIILHKITLRRPYNTYIMLFYPTIARKYFVKTQTYVALFGPHELSLIFSGGMCLELSSL